MGTSSSSKGPKNGVPLVPPWVPDPEAPEPEAPSQTDETTPLQTPQVVSPGPMASPQRFTSVRNSLRSFAKGSGGRAKLQQALGGYVRSYGGAGRATRRFGGTAQTAGALFGALSASGRGQVNLPGGQLDVAILSGRSANEVMDAVALAVRPTDGTQDAESSQAAIRDALSELLAKFPDAALLELTEAQRAFAVERYVAFDVFRRFMLDVGKSIQDKAPTPKAALARLKEAKDYIKETVSASFRKIGTAAGVTRQKIAVLAKDALHETFAVFESYAQ